MPNLNGNITLPNLEENESITVTGGALTIFGDVGSGARITLVSSQSTIGNNVFISNGHNGHKLIVQGNVHDQANITGSSDMEFQGYLSDHIKVNTLQGNIIVKGNVGSNTTLESINGNVSAGNVGSNTTLKSSSFTHLQYIINSSPKSIGISGWIHMLKATHFFTNALSKLL